MDPGTVPHQDLVQDSLPDGSRLVRRPRFQPEPVAGELILYSFEDTQAIYCNETAGLVWSLCDGTRTLGEIVELLQTTYPDAAGRIETDVRTVSHLLLKHGALDRC